MNQTLQALAARKSVRVFQNTPIELAQKWAILQAAFEAPTAGCQQLYTILDITDPDLKAQLSVLCDDQPFIKTAPLVLVFLADCSRWLGAYTTAGCPARTPGPGDMLLAVADAVIAAQNTVVAAESLGIGSCYVGDILENCAGVRSALHLPEYVVPAAMLVYGYPTQQQQERTKPMRFTPDYVVSENTYHHLDAGRHRAAFCEKAQREQSARAAASPGSPALPPFDFERWVTAFCKRKYESEFSHEMNRSAAEYLESFGLSRQK